ncbi:MAG: rubrerythrin family protein [Candidatus Bathyarchaeota archaeon]|nr:MAG: rubrerythrin family protein [Candidatus Bathyarchaeota archaeon]
MKERTARNVHQAYVAESKAFQRLLLFAKQAEKEGVPQIAHLFRAVAAAEGVHARQHFKSLEGSIGDTQTNLELAFQRESGVAEAEYNRMLREAEEDDEEEAALTFSQIRDVETGHAGLYKNALNHLIAQRETKYYLCTTCGYVSDGKLPENCPICGAPKTKFQSVD